MNDTQQLRIYFCMALVLVLGLMAACAQHAGVFLPRVLRASTREAIRTNTHETKNARISSSQLTCRPRQRAERTRKNSAVPEV